MGKGSSERKTNLAKKNGAGEQPGAGGSMLGRMEDR